MHDRRLGILSVALATAALAPGLASAKAPPKGEYGCTIGGGYAGQLHILDKSHYRVNSSKKGKFKTKGHKITFVTGVWKGLFTKGHWEKRKSVLDGSTIVEIALSDAKTGFENTYCDKE